MLETLIAMHNEVMASAASPWQRYLYHEINWNNQAIGIFGQRGVGKTTLSCQYLQNSYRSPEQGLYVSADNLNVLTAGLFNVAREFFAKGGNALCIDELHKYPNWPDETNQIIETYKTKKIILIGSSAIDIAAAKLSPRISRYELPGLSFREFLAFQYQLDFPAYQLDMIMSDHLLLAQQFTSMPILKYFNEYLRHGYYPFCLAGNDHYRLRVNKLIERVIFEDIAVVNGLKQSTLPVLKHLLWLIATADSLKLNIDKISKSLQVSREAIYSCINYLNQAGLILNLFESSKDRKSVRKPGKTYVNNTSLLNAIKGHSRISTLACEIMLANQVSSQHQIRVDPQSDFIINDQHCLTLQTPEAPNHFQVVEDICIGEQQKIPLYLFGFLY